MLHSYYLQKIMKLDYSCKHDSTRTEVSNKTPAATADKRATHAVKGSRKTPMVCSIILSFRDGVT